MIMVELKPNNQPLVRESGEKKKKEDSGREPCPCPTKARPKFHLQVASVT